VPVSSAHNLLTWPLIVGTGLLAVWSLVAHRHEAARSRVLWMLTALVHALIGVEVLLGGLLVSRSDEEFSQIHLFYGFLCLLVVGILYAYRQQLKEYQYLLYGGGGLFLMGLVIRTALLRGFVP